MRGLVFSLALLFLAGAQARYPWQHEEPHTQLQQVREYLESYAAKVQELGKEAVSQVEDSEIGKQLDLKITEKFDTLSTNALALKKQLHPYLEQIRTKIAEELDKDLPIIKEKIRPILENFHQYRVAEVKAFQEKVEPLFADLKKQTKENFDAFKTKLVPLAEDLRDKLRTEIDNVRTKLAPETEALREKLMAKIEELKANAGPRAEAYRAQAAQYVEHLKETLAPVAQNIRERLLPYAETAKVKLENLVEAVKARLNQPEA